MPVASKIGLVSNGQRVLIPGESEHCEREGTLHPGQYGLRKRRSAVGAVWVQHAWGEGKVAAALCVDVQQAWYGNA